MVTHIQFLMGYIAFIVLWSSILGLINEGNIDTDSYIAVPIEPVFSGLWITDILEIAQFIFSYVGYYFGLFFNIEGAWYVSAFIGIPGTAIAVYIILIDIILPLLRIIVPDWL